MKVNFGEIFPYNMQFAYGVRKSVTQSLLGRGVAEIPNLTDLRAD